RDLARRPRAAREPGAMEAHRVVAPDVAQVPGLVAIARARVDAALVPARPACALAPFAPVVGVQRIGEHEAMLVRVGGDPAPTRRAAEALTEAVASLEPIPRDEVERRPELMLAVTGDGARGRGVAEAVAPRPAGEGRALHGVTAERREE